MPTGKFFFIRSTMTDFVLTIRDNAVGEGSQVCPFPSHGGDNQIWYEDRLNGVIRSMADDNLVLEVQDDSLVVNPFEPEEYNQHWKLAGDHVEHSDDSGKCLDIAGEDEEEGARVCCWDFGGGANQLFNFEYLPAKKCYIKSCMNGKVIDIRKSDTSEGAKVHMYDGTDAEQPNQTWYEDKYGNIRSDLNDFVFDSSEDGKIRMFPYEADLPCRQWVKNGKKISNKNDPSKVVEIRDADSGNGAKVNEGDYSGANHQLWLFAYV